MSLHTPEQVAQELAVSKSTVMRLIARGELAAMKVRGQWRVHPDALAAYLRAAMPAPELPQPDCLGIYGAKACRGCDR